MQVGHERLGFAAMLRDRKAFNHEEGDDMGLRRCDVKARQNKRNRAATSIKAPKPACHDLPMTAEPHS